MQIHQLKVVAKKKRKRVGRGGKRGTYSGRGMKGQKSRSGGNVDPLFEGGRSSLVQRMKKLRGFKSIHPKKVAITLSVLDKNFSDGDKVTLQSLLDKKLLSKKTVKRGVKILNTGKITKNLIISQDILVSKGASDAIKKAGGKVELAEGEKTAKKANEIKKK